MKKTKLTRSLMAACSIVALSAVMYGCVHDGGSDDPEPVVEMPEPEPMPEPDPGPTDLEETQAAAAALADDAKTAADNAATAAANATAATENIAHIQTNGDADYNAYVARNSADDAMDAYMKAKAASDAAQAATTGAAAEAAWSDARAAKNDAEAAAMMAVDMADAAIEAAMTELHIDGTMKRVGGTTIDAASVHKSVTTGENTVITGLIADLNPMTEGEMIAGVAAAAAIPDNLSTPDIDPVKAVAYKQAAAARTFAIGKTLDSDDDMARLMIVTDHAGTNMVRVYAQGASPATQTGTKAGYISIDPTTGAASTDDAHANNTALRSEGMFYRAGTTDADLTETLEIGADTKAVELFSYTWTSDADPPVTTRVYATLASTNTDAGGDTTYTYTSGHDIKAPAPDGPDDGTDPDQVHVTVPIPAPVPYDHLHFGVWASLGAADAEGNQEVADFGIGFVQGVGDGLTGADMPNAGSATYSGNWVAVVLQGAGDDSMSLEHGDAELTANFGSLTLSAALEGLATLSGTIKGSTFEGTTARAAQDNEYGLTPGTFTGELSGAFLGAKAAEAGGVFDFTSNLANGGFRGAFGGAKD